MANAGRWSNTSVEKAELRGIDGCKLFPRILERSRQKSKFGERVSGRMELDTESEVNFLKFNDNNWSFSRIEMLRFVGKIVVQDRLIISLVDFSVQMINKVKKNHSDVRRRIPVQIRLSRTSRVK
ncbi:uncharacterized protein LOC117152551 [Bombus impatiens]|uniref:Uncharacterized protein LOC117152551 n=1 Tax=Bombus impatiens TaxID=132113 RepID=A0A6P8M1Q3_BOMIM|nr:uncharacterized protein LOC117152551 [Bombus impatiens]